MSENEAAVREQLREAVRMATSFLYMLLGVAASLPASPQETSTEDLEEMDFAVEARAVIANVVNDRVRPVIRDLKALVDRSSSSL